VKRTAPADRPSPTPALRGRAGRRPAFRAARLLLVSIGAAAGLLFVLAGVALAYLATTDSSNPAQAAAATLAAPTAGEQKGTATPASVKIKWTAPAGYTPTGYTVLRCTGSSCTNFTAVTNGTCSGTISGTSCTDTDTALAAGTTYSYQVEAGLDNWVSAPGDSFTAATSAVTSLAFTDQPTSDKNIQAAGTGSFSVDVAVEDANGNVATNDGTDTVTLAFASGGNPGDGTLSCTGGLTATVSSGVASFAGCAITTTGTAYELTASSATNTSLTAPANANSFNITPGTFAQYGVAMATTATAGTPVTVTLTAEDSDGNTVTSFSGNPSVTWTGPANSPTGTKPTLPAKAVSFSAGVNTTSLSVTFADTGAQTLTATDGSSRTGSAATTVSAGTLAQYGVGLASTATAGTAVTGVTLTAEDADGNTVTTDNASNQSITWSGPANSPNATAPTLPSGTVSFSGGVSTTPLSVTFTDAGSQILTATDTSSVTGSATATVGGAGPASLKLANCVLNGSSHSCTSGSFALTPSSGSLVADVQALDQYGNAASITSTITMSVSSNNLADFPVTSGASLTIDGTATPANQSTTTFTVTDAPGPSATILIQVTSAQSISNLAFTVKDSTT
jgi:hypothetical protein